MHQQANHDTSTQAMTEVALGLSMAFFSLLILALFSMSIPQHAQELAPPLTSNEQLKLTANSAKTSQSKASESKKQHYIFYFNGQFYDQQLALLGIDNIADFEGEQPLILAVQNNLPLMQVMDIRKQINHPKLSITVINENWQTQLEKMQ